MAALSLHSLPVFVRLGGRPVMLVGEGPIAEAKRRLLERAGAQVVGEDSSAALAIVVEDDAAVARLKARGVLVNAVDRPELCDFTLPAIVARGDVLVAIGTGGVSAGLAAALRQRLEAILPASLGDLAAALGQARARVKQLFPDSNERRRVLGAAMQGALDPLDGGSAGRVEAWLADPQMPAARVETIRLRSNDPDDLTLREARALAQADRVFHEADIPATILDRARADAERIAGALPDVMLPGVTVLLEKA